MSGELRVEPLFSGESSDVSEEDLLRALDRLGARKNSGNGQRAPQSSRRPNVESRRRRFGSERDVLVEHHTIPRQSARGHVQVAHDDMSVEVERLKMELRGEQRKCEALTRDLSLVKSQIKASEAHLMHARLRVQELENALRQKDSRLVALRQEQEAALEASKRVLRPAVGLKGEETTSVKRVSKPTKKQYNPDEPVRWWKD